MWISRGAAFVPGVKPNAAADDVGEGATLGAADVPGADPAADAGAKEKFGVEADEQPVNTSTKNAMAASQAALVDRDGANANRTRCVLPGRHVPP